MIFINYNIIMKSSFNYISKNATQQEVILTTAFYIKIQRVSYKYSNIVLHVQMQCL